MIWDDSKEILLHLLEKLNKFHEIIKFTITQKLMLFSLMLKSFKMVVYVLVFLHQYVEFSSHPPLSCKKVYMYHIAKLNDADVSLRIMTNLGDT